MMDIPFLFFKTLLLFQWSKIVFSSETTPTLPSFQRHLCFQDAIYIRDELFHKGCPYSLIPEDKTNCSIPCIGELEVNNSYGDGKNHGIDYKLLSQSNSIFIIQEEFLNFSNCNIKCIIIKCEFQYHKGNKNESDSETPQPEGKGQGSLRGMVGGVIGCSLGVMLTLFGGWVIKSLRNKYRQKRFFPGNIDPCPANQSVNNPVVYTEIEGMMMLVKATQVPSLKNNSPGSERSRTSNTYHTLAEMESLDKSTSSIHKTGSGKLRTSNHSSQGSRQSQSSGCSVREDVQQRESGESKKYFQLEQQEKTN